jgi:hypothetical protein
MKTFEITLLYGKEYGPILALFQARIWIRISIRMKVGSGSATKNNLNPDPHKDDKSNPDPHPDPWQSDADPQHWL